MPRYFSVGAMIRERLEQFTFELFRPGGQGLRGEGRRNLEGAFRLARQWAAEPDGWLVFLGRNGCGKTHLAAAIARYRLAQGDAVGFANVPDLLDELRASYAPNASERFDTLFKRLTDVPVLVLDDLGAHQSSPWAEEKLYQVLNHRHLARMHTVVTTNRELKQMEPRIASRLADLKTSTVYEITAPDFRTGGMT
jgi:DNA replication protein DnaC